MASAERTMGLTVVAVLALVQSALGVLRTLHWFDAGSDLMGQGLLLFPLMGVVTFLRGGFVAVIALLYVVFACGALLGRSWARWLGIVVAIVSLLLVVSVVIQGESPVRALVWSIVPVVMIAYLFSPAGRQALNS
jgi:type IV secretory pathway VirB2 component (pilin)